MLDPIYKLFGALMNFIYDTLSFQNYGVAIILFTIFTKLLLAPLSVKQMKSSSQSSGMQKELSEIQKLFKGDRERIAEETQKIYAKYGFSPMAGCLPTLIQFPVIIVLFSIVREPITYILGKSTHVVTKAAEVLGISTKGAYYQLDIMNRLASEPNLVEKTVSGFNTSDIINFNFLGINLGRTPTFDFSVIGKEPGLYLPLLLIPLIAAVTTYLQSWLMNKVNQKRNAGSDQPGAAGMMKSMTFLMPVMILFFAFQVPASMGLYWIIGNIFAIAQQFLIGKFMNKDKDKDGIIEVRGKNV